LLKRDGTRRLRISVVQVEREVLDDYCSGAEKDGVRCRVKPRHRGYVAEVEGALNVAKEFRLTQDCIRTRKKLHQIEKVIQSLQEPRERLNPEIIQARKILGLE